MSDPTYLVDVAPILEEHGSSVPADRPYALEAYSVGDDSYTLEAPAAVSVVVTNTGAGLVATGTVTADVSATCSRCLCTFALVVTGEVEGFYVKPGHDIDLPEEQEVEFVSDAGEIDLAPALHAAIVIETPFAPLHDPECAGICSTCGADLNDGSCSCEHADAEDSAAAEHPFAKLKELLGDERDDS